MSGHSKWSTIRRKKEVNDQARGKLFSKLSKAISVAVKSGGGTNPDENLKLKVAIEAARAASMPKENIDRAIIRAAEGGNLEEITYEGFGPGGVNIIVETATDSRNRTVQEIKLIFDRNGGNLGTPNSVAFNFEVKGVIYLPQSVAQDDEMMLKLIDLGAEDIQVEEDIVAVYTEVHQLNELRQKIEEQQVKIEDSNIVRRPKTVIELSEADKIKLGNLLDAIEENDDVQQVFVNAG